MAGGLALIAGCAAAPVAGLLPPGAEVVARFGDARALGLDGAGRLYVVDAASASVEVLNPGRERQPSLGGPGTSVGALTEPIDVDPTSGLVVFVADAVAGAVVRYTDEGQPVETVAVPDVDPARAAPLPEAVLLAAEGRLPRGLPVAVAALPGGGLAIVDASRGVVLLLDVRRRLERVVGGTGDLRLRRPVGVAVASDGTLWIADAGREAVVVASAVGEVQREVGGATLGVGAMRRVRRAGREMLVVGTTGVVVVDTGGAVVERHSPTLGEAVVDAARAADGALFVLTSLRLIRL